MVTKVDTAKFLKMKACFSMTSNPRIPAFTSFLIGMWLTVLEKPQSSPVCLLYSHTTVTFTILLILSHPAILCTTSWVSYNLLWHYLLSSTRSYRIKAQSHKTAPTPLHSMQWLTEPREIFVFVYQGRDQGYRWAGGFLGGATSKEPACQCRRHKRCRFDPWVGKIP